MALKTGQRPSAQIMRDPYAGHRDYDDPYWTPNERSTQWTDWDYALAEAGAMLETFTDPETGQPRWLVEDPDVAWNFGVRANYGYADLEREQESVKDEKGVTVYLKNPEKIGDFWTVQEWLEHADDDDKPIERGAPTGAAPPSPADMMAMEAARKERLRKALEG